MAAIAYGVTLLNAEANVVIASEMATNGQTLASTKMIHGRREPSRAGCSISAAVISKDRRIVLCHATEQSRLTLTCAIDHALETACPHADKVVHTGDFGQVAFTIEARRLPIHLTNTAVYHTSDAASAEELCGRAEWTLDRVTGQGLSRCSSPKSSTWTISGGAAMSGCGTSGKIASSAPPWRSSKRSASTFFTSCKLARAEHAGVPAKGLTGQAYEGHYFWDTEIYVLPFLTYTSPRIARIC